MALWGPAPACAHLGTAAGDPLMPGGQAPHRVWVRRCRLPAVGWGDGGHAGASGCSDGPSACPYPTRAGPSWRGCAHTGCRPGGPRPDTLRRQLLSGLRAGRLSGSGKATSQAPAAVASASRVQKTGRAWEDGGTRGWPRSSRSRWAEACSPPQCWHGRLRARLWRPHPSNAGYADLIPGWGTNVPHAAGQLMPCTVTEIPHITSETQHSMLGNSAPATGHPACRRLCPPRPLLPCTGRGTGAVTRVRFFKSFSFPDYKSNVYF